MIEENSNKSNENNLENQINQLLYEGENLPKEKIQTGIRHECTEIEFIKWISKIKILNDTNLKNHPLNQNINSICFHKMNTGYNEMMGILQALKSELLQEKNIRKNDKLEITNTNKLKDYNKIKRIIMNNSEKLQNLISKIDELVLISEGIKSSEFKIWKRNTIKFLDSLFGSESNELEEFKETKFEPICFCFDDTDYETEAYNQYKETLYDVKTTLQSYEADASEADDKIVSKKFDSKEKSQQIEVENNNKKVFIVHGHDNSSKSEGARFIEKLGFEAIILHEQGNKGKTIIEKIEDNTNVDFAIVIYTPCDIGGKSKDELKDRARQNVVFEHGYLMAKLGREKVIALVKGEVETPSDISGIVYETMDEKGAWKKFIADEMKLVGFEIDMNLL